MCKHDFCQPGNYCQLRPQYCWFYGTKPSNMILSVQLYAVGTAANLSRMQTQTSARSLNVRAVWNVRRSTGQPIRSKLVRPSPTAINYGLGSLTPMCTHTRARRHLSWLPPRRLHPCMHVRVYIYGGETYIVPCCICAPFLRRHIPGQSVMHASTCALLTWLEQARSGIKHSSELLALQFSWTVSASFISAHHNCAHGCAVCGITAPGAGDGICRDGTCTIPIVDPVMYTCPSAQMPSCHTRPVLEPHNVYHPYILYWYSARFVGSGAESVHETLQTAMDMSWHRWGDSAAWPV